MPEVSIGLPVRNGERYIREALEALLAQTFGDFELVVCDNASTDNTVEICSEYLRDPRVRVVESKEDMGSAANFNRCFQLTTAPLFMWAAHDDRFDSRFVEECRLGLLRDPEAGISVSSLNLIDLNGKVLETRREGPELASPRLETRIRSFLGRPFWHMIYGLTRREMLKRTSLFSVRWGADVILLWELILKHYFHVVEEPLFSYRVDESKTVESMFGTLTPGETEVSRGFAYRTLWTELWRTSHRLLENQKDRLRAEVELLRSIYAGYWGLHMFEEFRTEYRAAKAQGAWPRFLRASIMMTLLQPREIVRGIEVRLKRAL